MSSAGLLPWLILRVSTWSTSSTPSFGLNGVIEYSRPDGTGPAGHGPSKVTVVPEMAGESLWTRSATMSDESSARIWAASLVVRSAMVSPAARVAVKSVPAPRGTVLISGSGSCTPPTLIVQLPVGSASKSKNHAALVQRFVEIAETTGVPPITSLPLIGSCASRPARSGPVWAAAIEVETRNVALSARVSAKRASPRTPTATRAV